ncbi:glycoside-pentoside-hexuronide (GPH):cation symporter [Bilifractor sp. LCP19S3_H10]|uniref:glycoside-pentoside-hexuronide (GPH):cation symporter n=1 Tax=Bilifractor sp. LCP19S3_H10 TaxID=3438736 RepID=UPI003F93C137
MKLTIRNKAAFCFGAFGKDIVYMLVNSYLLYYYNVVLGISSAFIGAVLMGARIFDALNDPIMGIVVAKTRTRWGRFRPWILSGTVLNALTVYALFAVPDSMKPGSMKIWLTLIYLAWGVTYTLMDIPFWSMIPAITEPGKDREQLSSLARSSSGIGDAIPTVLTMIVVPVLSGTTALAGYRIGFRYWALIIAVVFLVSEIVFVKNVPEKKPEEMKSASIGEMFGSLFRNDQALCVVAAVILVYLALDIVGNLILYFFQFDLGNTDVYSIFTAGCFLAQVIFMMLVPVFRRNMEKLKLFSVTIVLQIAGFLILLAFAFSGIYKGSWIVLLVPGILVYASYGVLNVMLTIFLSDAVDYGEAKNGKREESVIFSMQTFTVKLASGIAAFISGLAIEWIGLDTEAAAQNAATLGGLRLWMTVPSALLLVVAFLLFRGFYRLSDKKMAEVMSTLRKQKQENLR